MENNDSNSKNPISAEEISNNLLNRIKLLNSNELTDEQILKRIADGRDCVDWSDNQYTGELNSKKFSIERKYVRTSKSGATKYHKLEIKNGGRVSLGDCSVLEFSEEYWFDLAVFNPGLEIYISDADFNSKFFRETDNFRDSLCLFPEYLAYLIFKRKSSFKICFVVLEDANKFKARIKIKVSTKNDFKKFMEQEMPIFEKCKSFATYKTLTLLTQLKNLSPRPKGGLLKAFIESDLTPAYEDSMRYNRKIHDELGLPAMYETVKSWI